MNLIDRDALIECKFKNPISYNAFVNLVKRQPTIDAVEVVHGEWIDEPNCMYRCSICKSHYPSIRGYMDYNYCPNCGAKMQKTVKDYKEE